MKNKEIYPLVYLLIASFYLAIGQNPSNIYGYYEELADSESCENCMSIYVSPKMFSLFSKDVEINDDPDLAEAIDRMTGLRFLKMDRVPLDFIPDGDTSGFYTNTLRSAQKLTENGRELLMQYRDGEAQTHFYGTYSDKTENISELVMLACDDDEFILLIVTGDLKLEQIARLADAMDIEVEGLEEIK